MHDEYLAKVEEREKELQSRLHEAIETLHGNYLLFVVLSSTTMCSKII
jgi:hypothetical protein